MVSYTNDAMQSRILRLTTRGEILKFFGVLTLMTRIEFGSRRSLRSSQLSSKYLPKLQFGNIISRTRFKELRHDVTFSFPADSSDRWRMIRDFIVAITDHRASHVIPSQNICVDESMSRWYGLRGDWIDTGLPHYVSMDQKLENGCELKTAACGKSGIIIRIENVVSAEDTSLRDFESEHLHGTAVTLRLLQPWFHTNRVVCADSYYASVHTAESLYEKGLRFTGVVKTSNKIYPMKYLSHFEIAEKGEHVSLVSKPIAGPHLMAVMWVDRDRRYFISSVRTTNGRTPIYRERWRTCHGVTRKEELSIRISSVCEQ